MSTARRLRRAVVESLYGVKRRLLRAAPVLDRVGLRRMRVVDVAHARDLVGHGVENLERPDPGKHRLVRHRPETGRPSWP